MKIDLVVFLAVLLFGGAGLWTGAIRQVANLGGLVAGFLASRPLGALVGPLVAQRFGTPLLFTSIACSFVLFFVVYALSVALLRLVLSKLVPDGEHGAINRLGGLLLGTAKAAVICLVVLSAVVLVEKPLTRLWRDYKREAKESIALGFARHHNLFAQLPQFASLQKLVDASSNPQAAAKLSDDPRLKALSKDPRIKSVAADEAVRRALENGDYAALLSSVKVLKLLDDPGMSEKLAQAASSLTQVDAEAPPPIADAGVPAEAEAPAASGKKPAARPRAASAD